MKLMSLAGPLLASVALLAAPAGIPTQGNGPSLVDTVTWIGKQIEGSTIDVKGTKGNVWFRREYSHTGFQSTQNSCMLEWTTHTRATYNDGPASEHDYAGYLALASLSPSATVQEWHMPDPSFVGSGNYPYYDVQVRSNNGQNVPFMLGVLSFPDQNIANRVATAVNHAIELCGGKKEPF